MRKLIKWIGIVVGGIVLVVLVAALGLMISSDLRFNRTYSIQAEVVAKPDDPASLEIGRRWAAIHCQACHGPDLGGGPLFEDDALGIVDAPNLTSGRGGIGARYQDADWVRALRHGVKLDGTSVFIMPSEEFYYLNDSDLGSLIAYLQTVPAVDQLELHPAVAQSAVIGRPWRMPGPMRVGRYCSIARSARVAPMNHPSEALTTHPVLYERRFGAVEWV